jgi:hypothetical protein
VGYSNLFPKAIGVLQIWGCCGVGYANSMSVLTEEKWRHIRAHLQCLLPAYAVWSWDESQCRVQALNRSEQIGDGHWLHSRRTSSVIMRLLMKCRRKEIWCAPNLEQMPLSRARAEWVKGLKKRPKLSMAPSNLDECAIVLRQALESDVWAHVA